MIKKIIAVTFAIIITTVTAAANDYLEWKATRTLRNNAGEAVVSIYHSCTIGSHESIIEVRPSFMTKEHFYLQINIISKNMRFISGIKIDGKSFEVPDVIYIDDGMYTVSIRNILIFRMGLYDGLLNGMKSGSIMAINFKDKYGFGQTIPFRLNKFTKVFNHMVEKNNL